MFLCVYGGDCMKANIYDIDHLFLEEEEEEDIKKEIAEKDEEEKEVEIVTEAELNKEVAKQENFLEVINVHQGDSIIMRFPLKKKTKTGSNNFTYCLKLPHHGSKKNIDESILQAIQPTVGIISHDNGHFGRAKDTHPNSETLALLQLHKVRLLLTNAVIKNHQVTVEKSKHRYDKYVQID